MRYISTRASDQDGKQFMEVVMEGLAPGGGLYVPASIPQLSAQEFKHKSYTEMALALFRRYIDAAEIGDLKLQELVERSYATFKTKHVVALHNVTSRLIVLELWHGPTYAFKDVALQFLGNLFEHQLQSKCGSKLTVVGATSGDTGGAAIFGLRGKQNVQCVILHPHERISPVQAAQMCTVMDANVHNIAVTDASFDDCQAHVKRMFADTQFNQLVSLGAVNSINWARIMAQITYFYYAYDNIATKYGEVVTFVVPTGNFGDVLAGYYAKQMGLPIKLVIATNANDILFRFFQTGSYEKHATQATLAPAMDIQVSSNFERLLWYAAAEIHGSDKASQFVIEWMHQLQKVGKFSVDAKVLAECRKHFAVHRSSDDTITRVTGDMYAKHHYVLDPHTACGVAAAQELNLSGKVVCLATAHPVKFVGAVKAGIKYADAKDSATKATDPTVLGAEELQWLKTGKAPFDIPREFVGIMDKERRCKQLPNDYQAIKQYIADVSANAAGK